MTAATSQQKYVSTTNLAHSKSNASGCYFPSPYAQGMSLLLETEDSFACIFGSARGDINERYTLKRQLELMDCNPELDAAAAETLHQLCSDIEQAEYARSIELLLLHQGLDIDTSRFTLVCQKLASTLSAKLSAYCDLQLLASFYEDIAYQLSIIQAPGRDIRKIKDDLPSNIKLALSRVQTMQWHRLLAVLEEPTSTASNVLECYQSCTLENATRDTCQKERDIFFESINIFFSLRSEGMKTAIARNEQRHATPHDLEAAMRLALPELFATYVSRKRNGIDEPMGETFVRRTVVAHLPTV
jgi:hypothetical protein